MDNKKLIIGALVIAVFAAFGTLSFKKSLTPYVSFAEARSSGRIVQVKGVPDHAGAHFDQEKKAFCFRMKDDSGSVMDVTYRGPKPGNFDQAVAVVAIGKFNGSCLESSQLLVKCPSKYEAEYPGATEHPEGLPMGPGARLQDVQGTSATVDSLKTAPVGQGS